MALSRLTGGLKRMIAGLSLIGVRIGDASQGLPHCGVKSNEGGAEMVPPFFIL